MNSYGVSERNALHVHADGRRLPSRVRLCSRFGMVDAWRIAVSCLALWTIGVGPAVAKAEPDTNKPAAGKLVIARSIEAKGALISEGGIRGAGNEQALGQ